VYGFIVYYQVFSDDEIIESKHPFSADNPYVGRVFASHVPPPHNVKSIKRFLRKRENIPVDQHIDLFASVSSVSKLEDMDHLSLLAVDGPGSDADDPIVLIMKEIRHTSSSNAESPALSDPPSPPMQLKPFSPASSQIRLHNNRVSSVCFSPDGSKIVSGSYNQTICIWDIASQKVAIGPISIGSHVYSVAFSPDGQHIVSGAYGKPYIRLWDAQTGRQVSRKFHGHTWCVCSVAFSPDGRRIASGSGDMTIRIWDTQLGKLLVGPIKGHTSCIRSVVFSPNGTSIASGGYDHTVRVWDATTGALIAGPFLGHSGFVIAVAFSPQGRWIASGSWDHDIRIWDTEAKTGASSISRRFTGPADKVYSVAFSPDGQWLASCGRSGSGGGVRIWNLESGQIVATLSSRWALYSMAISPKGDCIASAGVDHEVFIWRRK
jgi:WD40 repeat protein